MNPDASREQPRRSLLTLLALVLLAAGAASPAAASDVSTYTPERIAWRSLSYRASKLGVKADSEVTVQFVAPSSVSFVDTSEGGAPLAPRGERLARITIDTRIRAKEETLDLWLEPFDAAALQRRSVAHAKNEHKMRVYRFLEDGVFLLAKEDAQGDGDPMSWATARERFFKHPSGRDASLVMSEAAGLFYILSAADFRAVGDRLRFYHFDRDGTSEVTLSVEELVDFDLDYTEVSGTGERQVKETKELARVTISGAPVAGSPGANFEFLGMRGDVELFVDKELRVPLAVRGRVPVAGKTTVQVRRVVLE